LCRWWSLQSLLIQAAAVREQGRSGPGLRATWKRSLIQTITTIEKLWVPDFVTARFITDAPRSLPR
ncbi:MAG: hypothetical protein ACPHAN_12415, partial [Pseudomonadales bacterium]